jgi:hypothetical protein
MCYFPRKHCYFYRLSGSIRAFGVNDLPSLLDTLISLSLSLYFSSPLLPETLALSVIWRAFEIALKMHFLRFDVEKWHGLVEASSFEDNT